MVQVAVQLRATARVFELQRQWGQRDKERAEGGGFSGVKVAGFVYSQGRCCSSAYLINQPGWAKGSVMACLPLSHPVGMQEPHLCAFTRGRRRNGAAYGPGGGLLRQGADRPGQTCKHPVSLVLMLAASALPHTCESAREQQLHGAATCGLLPYPCPVPRHPLPRFVRLSRVPMLVACRARTIPSTRISFAALGVFFFTSAYQFSHAPSCPPLPLPAELPTPIP